MTARLRLWNRQLGTYPDRGPRYAYLALVVVSTIVLYYQSYVGGAVSPSVLAHFQISFRYYLTVIVISNAAGAVASLVAGLADRFGRANIVVLGLLVTSMATAFGIPSAPSPAAYTTWVALVGFMEGMALVATPALVRDFSPQVRRGTAMGIWTLGPVVGSLVVSEVASHTLDHLAAWQDQFHIAGITGLVVFVAAFLFLRELSPGLRDQLMVSLRERVLVEARARGVDVQAALAHPWRQMLRVDVVVPALGVSLFLLIYYAAVAFFVIYFTSVFAFSQSQANALGNWFWAADAVAVVLIGLLSDRLAVRKPFIVLGTLGAIALTAIFALKATQPATTYGTFVLLISFMSAFRGICYSPWMTAFSETLEQKNPALVATGLAVWGWILRAVVALSFLVAPFVVTAVTPVVNYGPTLRAIEARYGPEVATLQVIDPATLARLRTDPSDLSAIKAALGQIEARQHVTSAKALTLLLAVRKVPASDRAYLAAHGAHVLAARRAAPAQWQRWWWLCVGGEVLLLPTIFFLTGRWRPAAARRDIAIHRAAVDAQLAALHSSSGSLSPTP